MKEGAGDVLVVTVECLGPGDLSERNRQAEETTMHEVEFHREEVHISLAAVGTSTPTNEILPIGLADPRAEIINLVQEVLVVGERVFSHG